jgi:DNA polymerase III epsilon subunit-like protein
MRFLSLDFEASHKNPRLGCPVQLGIALMDDGGNVFETDEFMIKPPRHYKTNKPTKEVDAYALAVSGLTLEQIENEGLSSSMACIRLQEFVTKTRSQSLPVLAYNFSFDNESYRSMLFDGGHFDRGSYTYKSFPEILSHKWLCAFSLAKSFIGERLESFTLDDVAGFFGLARETEEHQALADAILAGKVYSMMTGKG